MELLRIGLIVAFLAVILSLSVIAVSGMSATYSEAFNISELRRLGLPVVLELPIQGYADFVMVDEVRLGTLLVYHNEHGIHLVGYMGLEKIEKPYPSYPILGTPLSYAYDRQPVPSLIAIGSSMGEALVFNITSKSVKYWYLQSSPYTVDEVMISTNGTLVAYSTSGYLRLYDVKSPGWVEIGPIVGNAVNVSVSGVYVYSAKMLLTLNKTREHKDLVAILESTRNFPSQLEFQVFFYNFTANATMPVAGVEAYLFSHDAHAYSPVARSNKYGYIVLPIPIPTNNATLYVRYNNSCFTFELSGLNITEPGTRVKLSTPLLLSRPSKGLCPEPSEAMKLVLVKAREALRRRAVNVIEVGHFIAKGHPRILGFIEPSRTLSYGFKWRYVVILVGSFQYPFLRGAVNTPVLLLQYLDERFRPVDKTTWVPIQSEPTSIAYSSDGSLIAIGFSNGLIAVFGLDKVSGEYKLLWEYRMRSPVTALEYTERLGDNKSVHGLLALDVLGHLQLLALGDKLFAPLLRINATLSFNTGYGSTISSTKDTNLVVVSGQGKLIIIVGLGSAVSRSPVEPIDLSKALLRPFRVKVIEPDGTPVANATVEIYKNNILLYRRLTNKDGIAYIGLITPGTYTIVVRPTKDWLETRTLVFKANPGLSRYEVIIKLSYKPINIIIRIIDELTREAPAEPMNVTVLDENGVLRVSKLLSSGEGTIELRLTKGVYRIFVTPVSDNSIYRKVDAKLVVPGSEKINITISRRNRVLSLLLVDPISTKGILEDVNISVIWRGRLIENRVLKAGSTSAVFKIPVKGNVSVVISSISPKGEPPLYKKLVIEIPKLPPEGLTRIVRLEHMKFPVKITILDEETKAPPLVPIRILVDDKMRELLKPGIQSTTIMLDKGPHIIVLAPQPGLGKYKTPLYSNSTKRILVKGPLNVSITLARVYAKLLVKAIDKLTRAPPLDAIIVLIDNKLVGTIEPRKNNSIILYVLKGNHTLQAFSKDKVYQPVKKTLSLKNDTTIILELLRTSFIVSLRIFDDTGSLITGAKISFTGLNIPFYTETISVNGEATARLPYGIYHVCIDAPGYKIYCLDIDPLMARQEVRVILSPYPTTVLARYIPLIIAIVAIGAVLVILYKKRERVLNMIAPDEEIF